MRRKSWFDRAGVASGAKIEKVLIAGPVGSRGGLQTALIELWVLLRKKRKQVKVITYGASHEKIFGSDTLHELKQTRNAAGKILAGGADLALAVARARAFNPDLFVAVGLSNSWCIVSACLRRSCLRVGQEVIANRSGSELLARLAASSFDAIGVQSPSMVGAAKAWARRSPVNVLPCLAREILSERAAPPTRSGEIKLCYVGRLEPHKGLELLISVVHGATFDVPVCVDIFGAGSLRPRLEQLCLSSLAGRVTLKGPLPDGIRGGARLATYDGLVLPSLGNEGLPLVLIEAMQLGLPILATNVGAVRDCCIGNPGAILVEPTRENLKEGLVKFVMKIGREEFNSDEILDFYMRNFSRSVLEAVWGRFLDGPVDFFT